MFQIWHLLCADRRDATHMKRFPTAMSTSVRGGSVTSKGSKQRRRHEKCKQSVTKWCDSTHTRLAQWQLYGQLTGGPLKFTNILYKAAKWLCTDSPSPAHVSVCTCMLTRRRWGCQAAKERQLWACARSHRTQSIEKVLFLAVQIFWYKGRRTLAQEPGQGFLWN